MRVLLIMADSKLTNMTEVETAFWPHFGACLCVKLRLSLLSWKSLRGEGSVQVVPHHEQRC